MVGFSNIEGKLEKDAIDYRYSLIFERYPISLFEGGMGGGAFT